MLMTGFGRLGSNVLLSKMKHNIITIKSPESMASIEKYIKPTNADWILNTDDNSNVFSNVSLCDCIKLKSSVKIYRSALQNYVDAWVYYIRYSVDKGLIYHDPWNRLFPSKNIAFASATDSFYTHITIENVRNQRVCDVYTTSVDGYGIYCVDVSKA